MRLAPNLTGEFGADGGVGRHWAGARRRLRRVAVGLVVAVLVAGCGGPGAAPGHGPVISPVGFGVTPAGRQSPLGDLPLASALSPNGRYLAVSNAGEGVQSLQLVDTASGAVVHTARYPAPAAVFVGLAFAPDGRTLYASGGGNNVIRRYAVGGGELSERPAIPLPTTDPAGQKINPYPAGIALTPDGRRLLVADQQADAVSVVDLDTGAVHTTAAGRRPYGVVATADGHQAYVTDQGADTVTVLDLTGPEPAVQKTVQVGTHPNRVIASDGRELFVADADSDEVSVIDTASTAVVRTIGLAPYPGAQVGSNPDGLALSADGRTLYVANSGNNDVAVVDVAAGRVTGLIPTGWYPTSVATGGHALFVTNGKGMGAGPNNGFRHPDPYERGTAAEQYAGSMIVGTLSSIDLPPSAQQLADWTAQVGRNDGFDSHGEVRAPQGPAAGIVPRHPGEHSGPIQHVIYVVKENRTYDQVFGSLGRGDGDRSLNLFGEESAPNARALERAYTTFDNFYADAEVSAQGWNWTVAANSNPYSEQAWPSNQSRRHAPYPSESGDPATAPNRDPTQAYIWDRLAAAHVSFRNYGMYIDLDAPDGPADAVDPVLDANTDHDFKRYDLTCPDAADTFTPRATCGPARIAAWRAEFDRYVAGNDLPTVELVRLPSDHNAGAKPGAPTPRAYVADNDWALGQLVDAVSHSPFWPSTAIFVTEDDAQDGPDHVDAHRTTAELISPYTRTGMVDSTFYSTASMLRTIELLVGIRPLTQFDAYATPMLAPFTLHADLTPYVAVRPSQDMRERNPVVIGAPPYGEDLSKEDRIDMARFNHEIWASVKGAATPMPAPRHTLFPAPDQERRTAGGATPAADGDDDDH